MRSLDSPPLAPLPFMDSIAARLGVVLLATMLALGVAACEQPTHENIERWRGTQKGPEKLESALRDQSLAPDLRAHAAAVLVALEQRDLVGKVLGVSADPKRAAVAEELVPRLWKDAKLLEQERAATPAQIAARDALFELRPLVGDERRAEIDGYLLDALTAGGLYEQRAGAGVYRGDQLVRAIGARAAPRLVELARQIVATHEKRSFLLLGPALLKALAATGSPDAAGLLLELAAKADEKQEDLQIRAMGALYTAYVEQGEEPRVDAAGLRPHLARLARFPYADVPGENINMSYELLAVTGMPDCLPPLVELARHPSMPLRLRAVEFAMQCGGAAAILPLAEALPAGEYRQVDLQRYVAQKVPAEARAQAAEHARVLVRPGGPLHTRFLGLELLGELGGIIDVPLLLELARERTRLKGYWGDQRSKPRKEQRVEPTLGARAKEISDALMQRG